MTISTGKVLESLPECLNAPSHTVPTVQYRLLNTSAPFDTRQNALFLQEKINLFATNMSTNDQNGFDTATSDNLIADTFSLTTPFIMMGLCIYAYGEPHGFALDGNFYGTQKQVESLAAYPGSPLLLRTDANALAQLGLEVSTNPRVLIEKFCQAQFDWGNPTWRAAWAFLHAYRIQVDCPNTASGEYIINEDLSDIGNCCSHAIPEGFGAGKTSWINYVRTVNARLRELQQQSIGNPGTDGYFLPFNVDQNLVPAATTLDYNVDPYRQPVDFAAYGRSFMTPTIEQWYRMGTPIPMDKDTKIRINMLRSPGNNPYLERFLEEMNITDCVTPVPALDGKNDVRLDELADHVTISHESPNFKKVPGGRFRIGIGLKGFFVKPSVCAELETACHSARDIRGGGCVTGNCG